MRRRRLLILVACAASGCGEPARDAPLTADTASGAATRTRIASAAAAPADSLAGSRDPASPRYCASDEEAQALACARGRAVRLGDSLIVRLDDALFLRVDRPDTGGTDVARHTYLGTLLGRGMDHVISEQLYEMRSVYLVDGRRGRGTVLLGEPVLAPGGERFAAAAMSLATCDGADGLEIWRLTDSVPARELALAPFDCDRETGWAPSDLVWRSPDTLSLVANLAPADSAALAAGTRTRRPAIVVRGARGWQLLLPDR